MKKKVITTLLFTLLLTLGGCTGIEDTPLEEDSETTSDGNTSVEPGTLPPVSETNDPSEIFSYIDAVGCNLDAWSGLIYTLEANEYGATMKQTTTVTTRKGNLVALQEYEDSYGTYEITYYEGGVLYTNYNGKVTHKNDTGTTLDVFKELVFENYVYIMYLFDSYVTYQDDYLLDFSTSFIKEEDDLVNAYLYGTQDYEYEEMYQGGYVKLDASYRQDTTLESFYYDYKSSIDYGYGIVLTTSQKFETREYTGVIDIPTWLQ